MQLRTFNRVLFIGAHCDDIEIGCGGTVYKLFQNGIPVHGLIITDTHYVRPDQEKPLRDSERSQEENKKAASILGYTPIFETIGHYMVNMTNERDIEYMISNYINKFKIDTVFTHWIEDFITPDHSEVGRATSKAARCCNNIILYNSSFDPSNIFIPNFAVDITDVFEKKIEALCCYQSEIDRKEEVSTGKDKFIEDVKSYNRHYGQLYRCAYAEPFRVVKALIK